MDHRSLMSLTTTLAVAMFVGGWFLTPLAYRAVQGLRAQGPALALIVPCLSAILLILSLLLTVRAYRKGRDQPLTAFSPVPWAIAELLVLSEVLGMIAIFGLFWGLM